MYIYGRNPIKEAFAAGKTVEKLYVLKGDADPALARIIRLAREERTPMTFVEKAALDKLADGGNHQGIVAQVTDFEYSSLDEILDEATRRGEDPLILILDGITDPHNLGAMIRSAECFGAHGVVIPKHRSAVVNETAIKVASGATEHIAVAKVTNINDAIRTLKDRGVWVYATDFDGETLQDANLTGGLAIVIGSEGEGIHRLTKELCDGVITIKQFGKVGSLNASVAAGVTLYEATRQRRAK